MSNDPDVLIVGAGPTGLTLAACLRAYDVDFELVDARTTPDRTSKALAINVVNQYAFAALGMRDELGGRAQRVSRMNVLWSGRRFTAVDLGKLNGSIKSLLVQPQWETEAELRTALERRGRRVRWGERLERITCTEGGVVAELADAQGATRRRKYRYVVGCDGKRSAVRESAGIAMEGCDYGVSLLLGDFEVRWGGLEDQVYYFVYPDTFFIMVPLGKDRWRVVVKQDGTKRVESSDIERRIVAVVRERLGSSTAFGCAAWVSHAPFYTRTTQALRLQGVVIAGDAAHLYSPIGGTGMNSGMQDAFNLAWKLALCVNGSECAEELLMSYERERLEAMRMNALATDQVTRMIAGIGVDDAALERLTPTLRGRKEWASSLPLQQSGLAQRYSAVTAAVVSGSGGTHKRVGEAFIGLGSLKESARLLWRSGHAQLCFDVIVCLQNDAACAAARIVACFEHVHLKTTGVRVWLLSSARCGVGANPRGGEADGRTCSVRDMTGLQGEEALLVRPDGIIAGVVPLHALSELREYLVKISKAREPTVVVQESAARRKAVPHSDRG